MLFTDVAVCSKQCILSYEHVAEDGGIMPFRESKWTTLLRQIYSRGNPCCNTPKALIKRATLETYVPSIVSPFGHTAKYWLTNRIMFDLFSVVLRFQSHHPIIPGNPEDVPTFHETLRKMNWIGKFPFTPATYWVPQSTVWYIVKWNN